MEKNEEQKVWVTVSETINIGNYESIKIEAGFSRSYGKTKDPVQLIENGIDGLEVLLKKKAKVIRKKRKE